MSTRVDREEPQAARLQIRVGVLEVSEHRLEELKRDPEWLRAAIRRALELVREVAVKTRAGAKEDFTEEAPELSLLSALPRPADKLAAREAHDGGFSHAHVSTLSGRVAFQDTGKILLARSDLLIALWDAAPRPGVGDAGDVLAEAIRLGIPILWIDAGHDFHLLQCGTGAWGASALAENLASRLRLRLRSGSNPQLARLVVRVGVASLGSFVLPDQVLSHEIREVLAQIRKIACNVRSEPNCFYAAKSPVLRLISTLVETTDQKVAAQARALGYKLQCVLPSDRGTCAQHFPGAGADFLGLVRQAERVLEIDGVTPAKQEAETLLLLQCDVLIVLSAGPLGPGSKDRLLAEALRLEIPIVWVDVQSQRRIHVVHSGERSEDPLVYKEGLDELGHRLGTVLRLPEPRGENRQTTEHERMARFRRARRRSKIVELPFLVFRHTLIGPWAKLKAILGPDRYPREDRWNHLEVQAVKESYDDPFQWADRSADFLAGLYRSSFLITYILGAMAVLTAFLGIEKRSLQISGSWFLVEFVFILFILALTMTGRRLHWHERWMDCRLLAEALRQMDFLALIGRVPVSVKVPAHLEPSDPRRSWFNWYFRALVRQAGLIGAKLDRAYLSEYRQLLNSAIDSQAKYHKDNCETLEKVHKRLHFLAQSLFFLAAIACVVHLVDSRLQVTPRSPHQEESRLDYWLGFCAIVLPSLGAALGAIHHTGEFERLALRSRALSEKLEKLGETAVPTSDLQGLSRIADDFSVIMMSELVDWRFVFLDKDLVLPA